MFHRMTSRYTAKGETVVEKKPERHEKRAADTTRGAKGTQGAGRPQAKKQYYAEE